MYAECVSVDWLHLSKGNVGRQVMDWKPAFQVRNGDLMAEGAFTQGHHWETTSGPNRARDEGAVVSGGEAGLQPNRLRHQRKWYLRT